MSAPLHPASRVADAATRMHRAVYQTGTARLRPWSTTLSSYVAMRVINSRDDLSLGQVARRCFVRPQTMTRMVAELEKRGWVERTTRAGDQRAIALRLSGEGRRVLADMSAEADKINATIERALSAEEIEQLDSLLRRCASAIEDELREVSPKDAV